MGFMDAAVHRPLIRSDALRVLLVGVLGLAAVLAVPVAWFLTIFDSPGWLVPASIVALGVSPFAGSAIVLGRWSRTRPLRWLQAGSVAVLLGLGALLVVRGATIALDELSFGAPIATSGDALPNGMIYVAVALIAIALLLAAIPLPVSDVAARTLVVTCVGPAVLLVGGAVVVQDTTVGCGGYELDAARWRADVRRGGTDETLAMAAALVRCDTLDGTTRAEVRELLGRPDRFVSSRPRWGWYVGTVNDALGPGDGEVMSVDFDAADRVRDTRLMYGGYQD